MTSADFKEKKYIWASTQILREVARQALRVYDKLVESILLDFSYSGGTKGDLIEVAMLTRFELAIHSLREDNRMAVKCTQRDANSTCLSAADMHKCLTTFKSIRMVYFEKKRLSDLMNDEIADCKLQVGEAVLYIPLDKGMPVVDAILLFKDTSSRLTVLYLQVTISEKKDPLTLTQIENFRRLQEPLQKANPVIAIAYLVPPHRFSKFPAQGKMNVTQYVVSPGLSMVTDVVSPGLPMVTDVVSAGLPMVTDVVSNTIFLLGEEK